jgi:hypothetical protein
LHAHLQGANETADALVSALGISTATPTSYRGEQVMTDD